jgi:guanine deaminase
VPETAHMERAIALARDKMRAGEGRPFGCVIVQGGTVVGEGWNTMDQDHDPTAHGEVVAIRDACRRLGTIDLSDCELYTSCEPCPMCTSAIFLAGIAKVYYGASAEDTRLFGNDPSRLRRQVALPIGERAMPSEQLLGEKATAVLIEWAEQRRSERR